MTVTPGALIPAEGATGNALALSLLEGLPSGHGSQTFHPREEKGTAYVLSSEGPGCVFLYLCVAPSLQGSAILLSFPAGRSLVCLLGCH